MSIFTIVGDTHVGKSLSIGKPGIGNALNSRVVDQLRLINLAYERAVENHSEAIIFTGDIFHDVRPNFRFVEQFIRFIKCCESNGITVHISAGNHDIQRSGEYYMSVLDIISAADFHNVYVYKKLSTTIMDGVGITFMPFRDKNSMKCETNTEAMSKLSDMLTYELESIPNDFDKVIVGHLAIEGSIYMGDEYDDQTNELMCPESMFAGYDCVWMGHVHPHQVMSKKSPYIEHIGSLDISDFGEAKQKKYIVVYDSDSKSKFKHIEAPTRPLSDLLIDVPEKEGGTKFVIQQINDNHKKKSLKNAIVRLSVKLPGEFSENIDRKQVLEHIYSLGAHHVCNFSESRDIRVVPIDRKVEIDNTIEPKEAVKLFARQYKFENKAQKQMYFDVCDDIIKSCVGD
jgi:DNA repair exonuclease SbcCD nuclease subunit